MSVRFMTKEVKMSNDPNLITVLNTALRAAEQAIKSGSNGKSDPNQQLKAINALAKVVVRLDERLVALEDALNKKE